MSSIAAQPISEGKQSDWSAADWVLAVALVGIGIFITLDAWMDMYSIGVNDEEQTHIFLVPVVAAWTVWVRRGRLGKVRRVGTWVGPVILLAGALLHLLGDWQLWDAFFHGGAIMMVAGCFLTVFGRDALMKFFPAFLVLAFFAPIPGRLRQEISMPLQLVTAQWTEMALVTVGVEAEREANRLIVNGIDLTVAEACNGLRMVFALVLVSYMYAFGSTMKWWARVLILVASPLLAIVCNIIRLIPTVWIYGAYGMEAGEEFHDASGWVMVPVGLMILMGLTNVLRWAVANPQAAAAPIPAPDAAAGGAAKG